MRIRGSEYSITWRGEVVRRRRGDSKGISMRHLIHFSKTSDFFFIILVFAYLLVPDSKLPILSGKPNSFSHSA